MPSRILALVLALGLLIPVPGASQEGYRTPPDPVVQLLEAPPVPIGMVSPSGQWMVLGHRQALPDIAVMAAPMLKLAGIRVSPVTNGRHGPPPFRSFSVLSVDDGQAHSVRVPEGDLGAPVWSPDGAHIAVTRTVANGIELWVADVETGEARAVTDPVLNGAMGEPCRWMPDGVRLLCLAVQPDRSPPPMEPAVPTGPVIQESGGEASPAWTFQDLLEDEYDEALFDYYFTSQPVLVDSESGASQSVGEPAVYASLEPSPSGEYLLAVRSVEPYSYLVPESRFPKEVEVLDLTGRSVAALASFSAWTKGVRSTSASAGRVPGTSRGNRDEPPRWSTWRPWTTGIPTASCPTGIG